MKMCKKLLSVLLAVLLVVTTLPVFSLNVLADDALRKTPASVDMRVLYDKLNDYETRISSGKIYTNYSQAYAAYINACKIYNASDANENNTGLKNAYNELSSAMNAMSEWTAGSLSLSPASTPSFTGDTSGYDASASYVNVVWGESGTSASRASDSSYKYSADLYYPQTVLLYDGTCPKTGVMSIIEGTANSQRVILYAEMTAANLSLDSMWHGSTNTDGAKTLDYTWNINQSEVLSAVSSNPTVFYATLESKSGLITSYSKYKRAVSNTITVNYSFGNNEYFKDFYPSVYYAANSDASNTVEDAISVTLTGDTPIYLINYKALADALSNVSLSFNVSDYQFGGLADVFSVIDEATSFNPCNYSYSDNCAQAVSDCAADIERICGNLSDLGSLIQYKDNTMLDPTGDLESNGDAVHMSNVIYTHLANSHFSMYGQEISDNYLYGQDTATGERFTSLSVDYPNYIDVNNPLSIYCLSDDSIVKDGYTFSDIRAKELYDGKWVDENGNTYDTDDAAKSAVDSGHTVTKEYYLAGNVSNYFRYNEETGEYTQTGVVLAVTYKDLSGKEHGEYQFPYVMPNPAWAHEIVGIRNQYTGTAAESRISMMTFTRFVDSAGSSTDINSTLINSNNGTIGDSTSLGFKEGTGNYKFISSFGNDESVKYDYSKPVYTADAFNFYDKSEGTNSGSYYVYEHEDRDSCSYASAANVVDVDYYIDYSDKSNDMITYKDDGVTPTGYQFTMQASNLYWDSYDSTIKGTASVVSNKTGLTDTYTSTSASGNINGSTHNTGISSPAATLEDLILYSRDNHSTVSSLFIENSTVQTAFPTLDNGKSSTDTWNGEATFTGKESVEKSTDKTSAETYANYIVQMGTYHHIGELFGDGYILGEENYHYYNIGVSTCDKGAVREFVETFTNQNINIEYTDETKTKIANLTATGAIDSGKYTVSSYRDYLDAVADAYWFLENPTNTTYYTDKDGNLISEEDEGNYTADQLVEHEFSTGYAVIGDNTKHALIYSTQQYPDQIGTDIFGTGETFTDPVQAQIIQHIIDAYNNLFEITDYEKGSEAFKGTADGKLGLIEKYYDVNTETGVRTLKAEYSNITENAKNTLDAIVDIALQAYSYDTSSEAYGTPEYWRYVELGGDDYIALDKAVNILLNGLMPAVDETALLAEIDTKQTLLDNNKCTKDDAGNTVQTVTYSSWSNLNDEVSSANTVAEENKGKNKLKLNPNDTVTVTIDGVGYKLEIVPEDTAENYSDFQIAVNDKYTSIKDITVSSIDEDCAYEVFDDAIKVVKTLDRDKYTSEGIAELDALVSRLTASDVYTTLSGDAAVAFGVDENEKIKVTGLMQTDPYTAELLNLITTLNESYVKKFRADFTIQYGDDESTAVSGTSQSKYYGGKFNFNVEDVVGKLPEDNVVVWSVTLYDGLDDAVFSDENLKGSQNISGYQGSTLERIADTNVKVKASILKGEESSAAYKIEVRNVYGKVVNILYADAIPASTAEQTITIGGTAVTAETIPFYTFAEWSVSGPDANNVVKVTAKYKTEDTYEFTVSGGSMSGAANAGTKNDKTLYTANFDDFVTISPSNADGFYGWAVDNGDGTYQIASYSEKYSFYACDSENFVPIAAETSTDDSGKTVTTYTINGKAITADMLDSQTTIELKDTADSAEAKASADSFVQDKLAQKLPFIAIQDTVMTANNTKVSAFVRVTEGCNTSSISSYGILYKIGKSDAATMISDNVGKGVYKAAVNNMLPTGQYVITLNSKTSLAGSITFRAYINYDYNYDFSHTNNADVADVSTKINVLDYSNVGIAYPKSVEEVQG